MSNHCSKTAGYYQGLARRYFDYLLKIADEIARQAKEDGLSFEAAREKVLDMVDADLANDMEENWYTSHRYAGDYEGLAVERLVCSVFPELNMEQTARVVRRAEKDCKQNIRRRYGRHGGKGPLRSEYGEARIRGDRLCRALGVSEVYFVGEAGAERMVEDGRYCAVRRVFQAMVARRYRKVTFIPSRALGRTYRPQTRRASPRARRTMGKAGDDGGGGDDGDSDGEPPRALVHPSAPDRARSIPVDTHESNRFHPSRRLVLPRCWRLSEGRCA